MPTKTYTYLQYDSDKPVDAVVHYGDTSGTKAIALAIHGGGFTIGAKESIPMPQIDYLVTHNFIVVSVDYRLCPNISLLEGPIGDTRTAYHWTINTLPKLLKQDLNLSVDTSKIVVFGHSAGGTLATMLGHESPRPKAILNFYGGVNLQDPFWSTAIKDFPDLPHESDEFCNKVYEEPVRASTLHMVEKEEAERAKAEKAKIDAVETGKDVKATEDEKTKTSPSAPEIDPRGAWFKKRLRTGRLVPELVAGDPDKHDPICGVTRDFPPTFFAHGELDILVNVDVSARYGKKVLDALGVETGLVVIKGAPHGYDTTLKQGDDGWKEGVQDGLDFLIKHVQ